jgi:glycosyltransferase 2 family protein
MSMPISLPPKISPDALASDGHLSGRAIRLALVALAGCGAVYLVWANVGEGRAVLGQLSLARLPVYFALSLAVMTLRALRWRLVLRRMGVELGLVRLAQLWLAGRAAGSLIPSGTFASEPVRAELLRMTGVPLATAAGAVALDRAFELSGNMIAGPASVGAALLLGAGSRMAVVFTSIAAAFGLAAFGFIYFQASRGRPAITAFPVVKLLSRFTMFERPISYARRADDAMHVLFAAHPRLVPAGIGFSVLLECVQLVELAALFGLFGIFIPVSLLLLSSIGIGVARIVPVSAALGSLEATQVGIFTLGGRTLALGLAVGLVLRVAETFWILVGLACLASASRFQPIAVITEPSTDQPRAASAPRSVRDVLVAEAPSDAT